jgi:predicted RNase H-like HicB family nuclease|nr:MAG TPA: HicB-like antitoxin [Caudoviricetes sp.]
MKYIYPVLFTKEDDAYLIHFPDFPNIFSEGDSLADAVDMAEDALNLWLWNAEESGDEIPAPSDPAVLEIPSGTIVSLVKADTLKYRQLHDTQAIKKTLTIPRWLDTLAKKHNVNFSNVLQNALINELNVHKA